MTSFQLFKTSNAIQGPSGLEVNPRARPESKGTLQSMDIFNSRIRSSLINVRYSEKLYTQPDTPSARDLFAHTRLSSPRLIGVSGSHV